jgi:cytochrome b involved in lipid metabolism
VRQAFVRLTWPSPLVVHTGRYLANVWSKNDTGIVVEDRVYDCTDFLDKFHPGSPETILEFAGKQCTWQVRQVLCQGYHLMSAS